MKKILILALSFSALITACNNSSGEQKNDNNQNSTSADVNADAPAGNAGFSCSINGKAITGQGIDEMQLQNTAFYYPDKDHEEYVLFKLYSTKDGNDTKPDYSFRIKCPAKVGTYVREGNKEFDAATMPGVTLDFLTGDHSKYWIGNGTKDIATVTITSITKTGITGTFSASMSLSNDTPNGAVKTISVTDGKFNIPFSTGNLRPE